MECKWAMTIDERLLAVLHPIITGLNLDNKKIHMHYCIIKDKHSCILKCPKCKD